MKKRVLSMLLVLVMALGLCVPALAADEFQAEEPIAPMEEEVPAVPVKAEEEESAEEPVAVAAEPVVMDETQPAATVLASGNCGRVDWTHDGSSVKWTLTSDGTLTIYGNGVMEDYYPQDNGSSPWIVYCEERYDKLYGLHDGVDQKEPLKIIKKVVIQEGVTRIGACAFSGCFSFNEVILPNSLTEIGDFAFELCSVKSFTLPNKLKKIEDFAFNRCNELTSITIPGSVSRIGDSAFSDCAKLQSVTIQNGVEEIGSGAFVYCENLRSITIPTSVRTCGEYAFNYCNNFTDVYYGGTSEQWRRMNVDSEGNGKLLTATIHYNSSGPAETAPHKDGWAWENNAHCFYRNGVKVRNDWVYTEGHYYWMKADGTMAWNEKVTVNGKDYYLGESGRMQTGWIKLPNGKDYYYADSSGALKKVAWQKWGNEKYWLMPDGLMARNTLATATYGSGSRIFSFSDNGKVEKNWIPIGNGNYRYGDPNAGGALARNQWVYWSRQWYWIKDNYAMARNEKLLINGSYYYFYDNGVMGTGWIPIGNGDYYYASSSGSLRSNYLFTYSGKQCYIKSNYLMARNETLTINGVSYTFDNSGYAVKRAQGNRPLDNLGVISYQGQTVGDGRCKVVAQAMALNLILGKNQYSSVNVGDGKKYVGANGKTYKGTYKTDNYVGSLSELQTEVEKALSNGVPIVVAVNSNDPHVKTKHHWVVIVGRTGNDYLIVDPANPKGGTSMKDNAFAMSEKGYKFGLTDYSTPHYGYVTFTPV